MKSFSDLTGKEKLIELLRWIFVPAASVLVVLALRIIAGFLMPPAVAQPPGTPQVPASDFNRFILPRIFRILIALAFVIAGAKTAPRWRFATGIVLAVLWILYSLNMHVLVHLGRGAPHYGEFVMAALAAGWGCLRLLHGEIETQASRAALAG